MQASAGGRLVAGGAGWRTSRARRTLVLLALQPAAVLEPFSGLRGLSLSRFERLQLAALPPSVTALQAQVRCGWHSCVRMRLQLQLLPLCPACLAIRHRHTHCPPLQLPAMALLMPPEWVQLQEVNQLLGELAGMHVEIGVPLAGALRPLACVSGRVGSLPPHAACSWGARQLAVQDCAPC